MIASRLLIDRIRNMDWNCINANTQYLTHPIHRYSGKFIPQIARQVIGMITKPGDLIVDPYCGSGTTLLECSLSERRSLGIDLSPLAVLIAGVKTRPVTAAKLQVFVHSVKSSLTPFLEPEHQLSLYDSALSHKNIIDSIRNDPRWMDAWFRKWFQSNVRAELIGLHRWVMQQSDPEFRNIGLLAFSDILRKCSNANPTYPNVMFDKNRGKAPSAIREFLKRLTEIVKCISNLEAAMAKKPAPLVIRANARKMPLADNSVDAVVTHPPYIGSIPYAEYGVLSLVWMGYDPKTLDRQLTGGRRQSSTVVNDFRTGFSEMFTECWRVLKPSATLFMLLGNPLVKGQRIDLVKMAREIGTAVGFNEIATHERNGSNRRANLMGNEVLLFFQRRGKGSKALP